MKINFEYVSALQYEVRALRAQVQAYKSGEAYRSMKEDYERQLREKDRIIAFLMTWKKSIKKHYPKQHTVCQK